MSSISRSSVSSSIISGIASIECVKGEMHNVITQLRLNTRKRHSYDAIEEHELVRNFQQLSETLHLYRDLDRVDCRAFLHPFIRVVISEETDANMTLVALNAIHKFILYGHVSIMSPNAADGVANIIHVGLHAKFDKASREDSDFICLKKMEIFLDCLRSPAGVLLSNESVCAIVEECYDIRSKRGSSSKLIARYAENIMMQMCLVIFGRSHSFPPMESSEISSLQNKSKQTDENKITDDDDMYLLESMRGEPYNISALYRVFRFLISLIQPNNENSLDQREFGLRLINICLETSGCSLANHPLLIEVIQSDLCKHLLQNSHTSSLSILSLTLRIIFDLFISLKKHLKVQLEIFFTSIHLRIGENKKSSFEERELVLESLVEFCAEPSLIVGLHRNYGLMKCLCWYYSDCEVGSTNLFEDLVRFLALNASYRTSLTPLNVLALQGLVAVLESISQRFCRHVLDNDEVVPSSGDLGLSQYKEKKKLELAAQHFNQEGKGCFKFLQGIGVLPENLTALSVALFLKNTPSLDKTIIGTYLGGEKAFQQSVLQEYSNLFNFSNKSLDAALRMYLESFRLPKEAQQIARVIELFSQVFYKQSPGPLVTSDAAYVLAYSVILLNTDAHNPLVLNKMTLHEFIRNNRGINANTDLPVEYLTDLYSSIVNNEILMSDGNNDSVANWDKMLENSRLNKVEFSTSASHIQGKEMVLVLWNILIPVLVGYVNSDSTRHYGDKVRKLVFEGCSTFSKLCCVFDLNDLLNNLIISMARATSDALEQYEGSSENDVILRVSENRGLQNGLVVLFQLVNSYGEHNVFEAWSNILHVIVWLLHLNLLPESMIQVDDFRSSDGQLFDTLKVSTRHKTEPMKISLFSSMFSLLTYPDPLEQAVSLSENVDRSVIDLISSLSISSLFMSTRHFNVRSLTHLVSNLVLITTYSSGYYSRIGKVGSDTLSPSLCNEVTAVFCLERLMEVLSVNTKDDRTRIVWNPLNQFFEMILSSYKAVNLSPDNMLEDLTIQAIPAFISGILSNSDQSGIGNITTPGTVEPTYFLERVIVNLFRVSFKFLSKGENVSDICKLFGFLLNWPSTLYESFGQRIIAGTQELLKQCSTMLKSSEEWKLIAALLAKFSKHRTLRVAAWEVLKSMAELLNETTVCNFSCLLTSTCHFLATPVQSKVVKPVNRSHVSELPCSFELKQVVVVDFVVILCSKLNMFGASSQKSDAIELIRNWLHGLSVLSQLVSFNIVPTSALDAMQQLLLARNTAIVIESCQAWKKCFELVLLPLVQQLSQNEECNDKLKLRVCQLLFQVLLHNVLIISNLPDFHVFWLKFIGIMEKQMKNDSFSLHFYENMKNLLMIMYAQDVFTEVGNRTGQDLSTLTWNVIGHFKPEFKKQLEESLEPFLKKDSAIIPGSADLKN